jgi:hypothetical protein
MKIVNLFILSLFCVVGFQSVVAVAETRVEMKKRIMVDDAYEAPRGKLFNEDAFFRGETLWHEYNNVIVINKAPKGPSAQRLQLYVHRQLVLTTKVSTGLEDLEYIHPIRGIINGIFKGATSSHWRHTTRGFYTIKRVHNYDYRSGESKFQMPYAMFFNDKRGLAIHQVPPDLSGGELAGERALGSRASSGCVRVHKDSIQQIHSAVVAAGRGNVPLIDSRTGAPVLNDQGQPRYGQGYKTLVIIEEY